MVLLLPTAIRTPLSPILSPPKSKINKLLLLSNTTTSFKTNFPSSNLFPTKTPKTPIPIHVSINGPSSSSPSPSSSSSSSSTATTTSDFESGASQCTHWMVVMDKPPDGVSSKSDVVDYYVRTLANVLGSEKEAQMCIYDASWETHFGFCCDIDEETSRRLFGASQISSEKSSEYWLVRMEKPAVEVVTKAQMVDYYAQTLTKVLGNEKDAQMCLYHISWQNHFGFCCEIEEECARELAGVPGVLSVQPDSNYGSSNKDYGGDEKLTDSSDANQTPNIRTKRLFVTGLSFYTSEKTLRAAFEGFGELVEVKIIMDKISKRSKGYAFIEYTTEEAAGAALKEMNGKIINGWMIVVDVAKMNPPRYSRDRPRPTV